MNLTAEKILDFQQRLLHSLTEGCSMQDLLDIAHTEFNRPMFIKGDGSMIYAITNHYSSDVHPSWSTFIKNMDSSSAEFASVRTVSEDPDFSQAFTQKESSILKSPSYKGMVLHSNVWIHEKRVCEIIVLENGKPFKVSDKELMDIFSSYVELHVSMNRNHYLAGSDLNSTFTALLENKAVSPMELLKVNSQTGWKVDDEFAIAAAVTQSNHETPLLAVFRDKLKTIFRDSVTLIYQNHVVSVINISKSGGYGAVCRQISKLISGESLCCGLSFEFTGIERTLEYYNLALLACTIADNREKKFLDMYHAAPIRISERMHAINDLQDLIHPDLVRLDRLDPQRTSNYLKTLYAYLLCGGNYTDTANYLGLHRNSLIYRMNRIQSIVKSDLNDVHNRHFLLISYLLMGISF